MDKDFMLPEALKGQQWERCKGELRAMVALQGSITSTSPDYKKERWSGLKDKVDHFISDIEGWGLHE